MAIFQGVGAPGTVGPASGGKIYAYNALTTLQTVAPANASRVSITFHNPGAIDIFVGPVIGFASLTAAQGTLTPTTANYGGCFRVFANGGTLVVTGECQGAWQALTSDASTGKLTVMDSNVS
jgi:hypothetical protein